MSETLEITGKIVKILPEKSGVSNTSQKEYTIQYFVIVTDDNKYPKNVAFQAYNKNLNILHDQKVKVFFDIESKEFNGKYFTNLNVWKIE